MSDSFWNVIDAQLAELQSATTADRVIEILANDRNPYGPNTNTAGHGFFAGSGGDDTVAEALTLAGWKTTWAEAPYYYAMEAPDGTRITYIEGDIYRGDTRGE
jgi:hypothetical protein